MSGYDPTTGVFELSPSQIRTWFRRKIDDSYADNSQMTLAAEVMRQHGLDVLYVAQNHILVRANQPRVWEALSGLPSDPSYETFTRLVAKEGYYSATYLSRLTVPQMAAAALNKRLAAGGFALLENDQWKLTPAGRDYGIPVKYGGRGKYRGTPREVVHWSLRVLDELDLYWPRPDSG